MSPTPPLVAQRLRAPESASASGEAAKPRSGGIHWQSTDQRRHRIHPPRHRSPTCGATTSPGRQPAAALMRGARADTLAITAAIAPVSRGGLQAALTLWAN